MKYLAKSYIISIIALFVFYIVAFMIAIVLKNLILSYILTLILLIIVSFISYKLSVWYPKRIKKLSSDKFKELKDKMNQNKLSLFERLYVYAYNDVAVDILEPIIKENNIKYVKDLDFDASYDKEYITFTYCYKNHNVYHFIYQNNITYRIDSPKQYDYLEINEAFEKAKVSDINIFHYNTLEEYFTELLPIFKECIHSIEEFEEAANSFKINQKTLEEIKDYKDYNKSTAILLNVLSLIMTVPISVLTYTGFSDMESILHDHVLRMIVTILALITLPAFIFISFIYSIVQLVHCRFINKDILSQNVLELTGKPYKVKLMTSSVGYRHNVYKFGFGVKLYFKNGKKIKLKFAHYFDYPNRKQAQSIKEEILKKNFELKYYKKSKYIVFGAEIIRKIIKRKI